MDVEITVATAMCDRIVVSRGRRERVCGVSKCACDVIL